MIIPIILIWSRVALSISNPNMKFITRIAIKIVNHNFLEIIIDHL